MSGKVEIEDGNLVFRLHGVDKVLALKSELKVPLKHVKSVSTAPADWNTFKMLRVVGTGLSGIVKDGTFASKDGLLFYEMHDPNKCITVELEDEKYKKVVFEVEDKETVATKIKTAISR